MSDQDSSRSKHRSLANLLENIQAAENPEQLMLDLTIERIGREDHSLAEAIRYCAIPRRFDAEIIGVLRGAPDDRDTSERLLDGLLSHSFVLARQDSGYVYHDNTRDMLLEDWQADEEKRARFDMYNRRLVTFYRTKQEKAQEMERDLEAVAKVVQEASRNRYAQLASIVEKQVVTPLFEAIYHETLRSALAGYELFVDYYTEYERRARLTVCKSLLSEIRSNMRRLPPRDEQDAFLRRLDYWEGRLLLARRQYDESEEILRDFLAKMEDEEVGTQLGAQLKLWALNDLGRILQQRFNLHNARETYEMVLDLARETPEDHHNLPLYQRQLAGIYWGLGELDQAADAYREAIQTAHEVNPRSEVFARVDLSGVLQERGEWAEAFGMMLEALHLARTELSSDYTVYQAILARFMYLLARRTTRLLDTLFAESEALRPAMGDPLEVLYARLEYANLLQEGSQFRRAEDELNKLWSDASDYANTAFGVNMLFGHAMLRENQGQLDEAIDLYTQILERPQEGLGTPYDSARALSNRGLHSVERSLLAEAGPDLQAALAKWEEIGNKKMVALLQLFQASMLRRQGQLADAQQLVHKSKPSLEGENSTDLASYHRVQGEVYRDQALWSEASQHYEQEVAIRLSLDEMQLAAQGLVELANVAGIQGEWEQAARHAAKAGELWRQLSNSARYQPSEGSRQADQDNAYGIQRFVDPDIGNRETLGQARESFHSASQEDPDNFWYRLNLAYAHAALAEWDEAAHAVKTILEHGPEWLHTPVLYERLAEYGFRQGNSRAAIGDYMPAIAQATHKAAFHRKLGLELRAAQEWDGAREEFGEAFELDHDEGAYHREIALTLNAKGVAHSDRGEFREAIACYGEALDHVADNPLFYSNLAIAWESVQVQGQRLAELEQAIAAMRQAVELEPQNKDYAARLESLERQRTLVQRYGEIVLNLPVATPISVEVADNLVPKVDSRQDGGKFLFGDIPVMRDRVERELGARLPGVRFRSNVAFTPHTYRILIEETREEDGSTFLDWLYCPVDPARLEELSVPGHLLLSAPNPRTGEPGCWLPDEYREPVAANGLELWTETEFLIYHLEVVLRQHLPVFFGMQEAQNVLDRWASIADESFSKIEDWDIDTRLGFARLLRTLLDEQVPITAHDEILEVIDGRRLDTRGVVEAVRDVRLRLKQFLPGNAPDVQRLLLPAELEAEIGGWLQNHDGQISFSVSPLEMHDFLMKVGDLLPTGRRNVALVVGDPDLRPFVRRLVAYTFPYLMVLSAQELVADTGATAPPPRAEGSMED